MNLLRTNPVHRALIPFTALRGQTRQSSLRRRRHLRHADLYEPPAPPQDDTKRGINHKGVKQHSRRSSQIVLQTIQKKKTRKANQGESIHLFPNGRQSNNLTVEQAEQNAHKTEIDDGHQETIVAQFPDARKRRYWFNRRAGATSYQPASDPGAGLIDVHKTLASRCPC